MADQPDHPFDPALTWSDDGSPRSGRFGDVYFSAQDGLAETRAVFLEGCDLPAAWAGRRHFTVAELGFGTGLNVLALMDLWLRTRPEGGRLSVFSIEAFPMSAEEAGRALARWPELAEITELLLRRWPPRTPGFHRIDLSEFGAVIDLAILEVAEALSAWSGAADAWFLDGFSPASNPAMWRDEVLDLIAARSAPGARAATFTVAGHVRRGLSERGFAVAKQPGFGRKRERLEAVFEGSPAATQPQPRVAIVGGGIAGAALVRAFKALGADPVLVEAAEPGAGASGNAAALVTPRLDAGGGPVAMLYAQAFERAVELCHREAPDAILAQGVLQLEHQDRDTRRFDTVAAQPFWAPSTVTRLSSAIAAARLGEVQTRGGLDLTRALVVEPLPLLQAWLGATRAIRGKVAAVERREGAWRLLDADGAILAEAEIVCVAAGWGNIALRTDLPLSPVRGQATTAAHVPPAALAWGGYVVPTRKGLLFGATHDRGDTTDDLRPEDDRRNLESLARVLPVLAAQLAPQELQGRASIRAVTPDRLPLAGSLRDGLHVLGGLGSRGFCAAPLLAEHVAAMALGTPSPLPRSLAGLVAPSRFA
ncbi:MAG: FAD-dependent 5-carboxymethylaminomethyl-2-thiouridine(34) oxidoreductase MnmC [Proteobacteria bacterium]|nr:FAD-dependent 5-carboxymethylaminomethyl-2-thiouridine(34) oxidoreductase MnmC [Pseudomonadota bacterium]